MGKFENMYFLNHPIQISRGFIFARTGIFKKKYFSKENKNEIAKFYPRKVHLLSSTNLLNLLRTIPEIQDLLKTIDNAIRLNLLPALLVGHIFTDNEVQLLSLPPKLGGLGIPYPHKIAKGNTTTLEKLQKI